MSACAAFAPLPADPETDRYPEASPELADLLGVRDAWRRGDTPDISIQALKAGAYTVQSVFADRLQVAADRFADEPQRLHSWCAARENRRLVRDLTEEIAAILETATGDSYRRASDGAALIDLVTGDVVEGAAERWKRRVILPAAWSEMRGPVCRDLQAFLADHPRGPYARYIVMTGGPRVTVEELPDAIDAVRRRVKRIAEALREMGIDVLMRSTEFPFDPETMTHHVHVNLIVLPCRYIKPSRWQKYLKALREANGGYWIKDNGRLGDVQEAVKYCLKGEDLEQMMQRPADFVAFAAAVSGTAGKRGPKLVQPMGGFREWRKALEESGRRTVWDSRRQAVVVVEKRKRPKVEREAVEMGDIVDPETGEIVPPSPQEPPKNLLRGLMWCRASLPWATPHAIVAGYDKMAGTGLWSDLSEALRVARTMFQERTGLTPVEAKRIAAEAEEAARAVLTASERAERRRQVRDLRKGRLVSLAFSRLETAIQSAGALIVHNGTSSAGRPESIEGLESSPSDVRYRSTAEPPPDGLLRAIFEHFPGAEIVERIDPAGGIASI